MSDDVSWTLAAVLFWPLAQIYPQAYLFGNGQILPVLSGWISAWLSTPVDLGALLRRDYEMNTQQYGFSEMTIVLCGLSGAVLSLSCLVKNRLLRFWLALGLVTAAIIMKLLTSALLFMPQYAFAWLTPGARDGLLLGLMLLGILLFLPTRMQAMGRAVFPDSWLDDHQSGSG